MAGTRPAKSSASKSELIAREVRKLEAIMKENEEIDRRLLDQGHRMLQTKARQQDLMDLITSRLEGLYARWQHFQDAHQQKLTESFHFAAENLPRCGSQPSLSPEEVTQLKMRLETIGDKTASSIHRRVHQNGRKLEDVAVKAQAVEERMSKLLEALTNTSPQKEAKTILLAEIGRLENVEDEKRKEQARQLAVALRQFLGKSLETAKTSTSPTNSVKSVSDTAQMNNGEISAAKPGPETGPVDSLIVVNKQNQ